MLTRATSFRFLVVFALCATLPVAMPARAQRREQVVYPACREVRNLDALQYWFWEGFSGLVDVHDFTHERWGRLGADNSICFRIALVVVNNPQLKSAGYRQAVNELLQWAFDEGRADKRAAKSALEQLERVTGEDFDGAEQWIAWWQESQDFVMWSEEQERLVVVAEAQQAGETVHVDALLLDAEEYWFYAGRGWLSESDPVGEYVFGSVLIPPHDFNFRAVSAQLQDRDAKERGYRRALDNLFVDGLLLPDLQGNSLDTIIRRISRLTEESYSDRDGWVRWWNQSRDRLVLSPAGDRLVVRQ